MKTITTFFIILLPFLTLSQDIRSTTEGFSASLSGQYSDWESSSFFLSDLAALEPSGIGVKVDVGYGLNQRFSFHLSYQNGNYNRNEGWDAFSISSINASARINFGATLKSFRPYLGAGLSSAHLKVDPVSFDGFGDYELVNKGLGYMIYGGVDFFIKSNISVGGQYTIMPGSFNSTTLSGEQFNIEETVDFNFFIFNLGLRYYFE